ncbi:type II toxin-antitoxin system VapC family toxin [Solicola gregarius]|uniref:Ribonuclease VapC n=1 Tax=Solicola gregarius TaxID=2908642 RepID=A0AA46YJW5_9ACTN|nr:type II toxin-antitoxin system VapC family toxin [Solicola gregarius]UYM04004.1 type II toxin-antitoxin system VapC family toxin [Solicola gregarius]
MKVVDANVLLYAVDETSARHEQANRWLSRTLKETETIGFCWIVLIAFVRLSTHPSIQTNPLSPATAIDIVDGWLARPPAVALEPAPNHLAALRPLLESTGTGGNLVNDAHIAAIAREHGATVVTYDNDFGRFDGVRWEQPK